MHRFFVSPEDINDRIVLSGENANHASSVLRIKSGEKIVICDGLMMDYICEVQSVAKTQVAALVINKHKNTAETGLKITVYQGLPKGDKLEQVVQKAVELGAYAIVPMVCQRSVAKADNFAAKQPRLQKISEAAAKQSHRGIIPNVGMSKTIQQAIDDTIGVTALAMHTGSDAINSAKYLRSINLGANLDYALFIGPEGGFANEEIGAFKERGIPLISLGGSVLRTETAAVVAIANIQYEYQCQYYGV